MAALIDEANTRYLSNSSPKITGYPFTVGCWTRPANGGAIFGTVWSLSVDTGGFGVDIYALYQYSSNWVAFAGAGASSDDTASAGTIAANTWYFVVCRFISATNRRIAVLRETTGLASHGQGTTSISPPTGTSMKMGVDNTTAATWYNGRVAEFWYTNTDIQPNGAALVDSALRKLAYEGPWSVPNIAKDILEYRPLRQHIATADCNEVYFQGSVPAWVNTNGVLLAAHPTLSQPYRGPSDYQRNVVI